MIKTFADLLDKLLIREKQILDRQIKADGVTHRPTIGDMFEDLSQDVLRKSVPVDGLVVTGGFIRTDEGLGPELDCILAKAAGECVARTDKRIFNINDVLAVVQVKRTLYKSQIDDGFANLASVPTPTDVACTRWDTIRRVFQQITGRPAPENVALLPPTESAIWRTIVADIRSPTRILLGFNGFANESTFRKGLVDLLTQRQNQIGSGPRSLPSLIIGGNASAIKGVGLPWSCAFKNGWWQFLGTTSTIKPAHLFLEAIWTRLVIAGYADDRLFGEDLDDEVFNAFVDARFCEAGKGWELRYSDTNVKPATGRNAFQPWTPHFVSHWAFVVANLLCSNGSVSENELETDELRNGAKELESLRLVGRTFEDENILELTTERATCVILPDGRYAVGEDNSGRLTRWVEKFQMERRQPDSAKSNSNSQTD